MASSFSERLLSVTQDYIAPAIADGLLGSNRILTKVAMQSVKPWIGEQYKYSVKTAKNTNNGSFFGSDLFSVTAVETRQRLKFDPKFFRQSVTVPMTDVWVNGVSESQVISLVGVEVESAKQDMDDEIGDLLYLDGTGNGSKDFLGLSIIVDDGTTSATYGELTRATYDPVLDSTVTVSGGTVSLDKLATLHNAASSGSVMPQLGLTTEAIWSLYEKLIQQTVRINRDSSSKGAMNGGAGFADSGLDFRGMKVMKDEKCTSGVFFMLNTNFLHFYALNPTENPMLMSMYGLKSVKMPKAKIEGNDYSEVQVSSFAHTDWIQAQNGASVTMHMYMGGNFFTQLPARHAKLTGITGV